MAARDTDLRRHRIHRLCQLSLLASADRVRKRMGETGIRIMMRIMGLMLTAIAVQFVINGLARMNIITVSPQ